MPQPPTDNSWTIRLPFIPENVNRRERRHWAARHRERREVEEAIWAHAHREKVPLAKGKRSVSILIAKGPRSRRLDDAPNLDSRSKSILDAMVALGLLIDDAPKWLDWHGVTECKAQDGPYTIITITDTTESAA